MVCGEPLCAGAQMSDTNLLINSQYHSIVHDSRWRPLVSLGLIGTHQRHHDLVPLVIFIERNIAVEDKSRRGIQSEGKLDLKGLRDRIVNETCFRCVINCVFNTFKIIVGVFSQ